MLVSEIIDMLLLEDREIYKGGFSINSSKNFDK